MNNICKKEIKNHQNFSSLIFYFIMEYKFYIILALLLNIIAYTDDIFSNLKFDEVMQSIELFYERKISIEALVHSMMGLIKVWFVFDIFYRGAFFVSTILYTRLERDVRLYIFKEMQKVPMSFFSDSSVEGQVENCMSEMADGMSNVIDNFITTFIPTGLFLIITSLLLMKRIFYVGLVTFIWCILHIVLSVYFIKKSLYYSSKLLYFQNLLSGQVIDSLLNRILVKIFNRQKLEYKYMKDYHEKEYKAHRNMLYFVGIMNCFLIILLLSFAAIIFLYVVPKLSLNNSIKKNDIIYIFLNIWSILRVLWRMSFDIPIFIEALGQCYKCFEILPKEEVIHSNMVAINSITSIEFRNVSLKMKDKIILNNINFTINKNEKIVIIGASGSGKTSLLKCLTQLEDGYLGEIFINGINIKNISNINNLISFLDQHTSLFSRTIRDNLLYGNPHATEEELNLATQQSNIYDTIMALPDKYDSMITNKNISGGERQRICIARFLLKNESTIILDEFTNGLDNFNQNIIINYLKNFPGTCISIEHTKDFLYLFDKIYFMENGSLTFQGTHQEILKYSKYNELFHIH